MGYRIFSYAHMVFPSTIGSFFLRFILLFSRQKPNNTYTAFRLISSRLVRCLWLNWRAIGTMGIPKINTPFLAQLFCWWSHPYTPICYACVSIHILLESIFTMDYSMGSVICFCGIQFCVFYSGCFSLPNSHFKVSRLYLVLIRWDYCTRYFDSPLENGS